MLNRTLALSLTLLTATTLAHASASSTFNRLNLDGKKTGFATCNIEDKKGVIKVHCETDSVTDKSNAENTIEYQIGKDGLLDTGMLGQTANQTVTMYMPSKANDALTVRTTKAHVETANHTVAIPKPEILLALPNDPSVFQVALQVATAHPHADNTYYLYVPGTTKSPDRIEPFRLHAPKPAKGTLDGKPVTLQHYILTFHAG
ncbi:MAG: hypothetical protein V4555_18395, partial [Acidobacteriota bacterium]